jgi:DNA (cytosine-5)-methyltransferase 1
MTTHGELFAGIGGFGLGFDNAGMKTIWHVEIDKNCQDVLRRHNPDSLILSDVCEAGKHNLPHADVISFGSPCQDLSIAGKRKGLIDGERSSLFFEAIRIVDELKPVIAVWENVPGALSSNSGRDFAQVLGAFRDVGARDIAWRILDAQYFGVPQRRRRIFVIADFGGERAAEILFESESVSGNTPKSGKAGETIARTLATGSNKGRYNPTDGEIFAVISIAGYKAGVGTLRENGGDLGGGSETLVAYNIQHNDGGEHIIGVRRLTPTECERLQGFPDGWTDGQSDSTRYRQLGNAVAVPVVQWIGKRISDTTSKRKETA